MQKCQFRAREIVYWPGISKAIENIVSNCETCLKFNANNRKQSSDGTLGHKVPTIPWSKLAMDIFTFDNKNYLVVVNYTSKVPLIRRLSSMTAQAFTEMLKWIFAECGLLICIVNDNGPCYALEYSATEMHKLGIKHNTDPLTTIKVMNSQMCMLKLQNAYCTRPRTPIGTLTSPWWCIEPLPLELTNQA